MLKLTDFRDQRIHMIGVGGSSMSGLCEMLLKEGYCVTGSDRTRSHAVERLEQKGVKVTVGHLPETVHGAGLIIYSAAIPEDNPERAEAFRLNIPQMERAVLLGQLMLGHDVNICISGAHGKTTTSSMTAWVLLDNGLDPTVSIGGRADDLGGGSRVGSEKAFVAEACEFHGSFLHMFPTVAVVLNIDADHLDYYGDMEHIVAAFDDFLHLLPENGVAVGWGEDERVMGLLKKLGRRYVTFGMNANCDYYAGHCVLDENGCGVFDVMHGGEKLSRIALRVAGAFNVLNALAAFAAAREAGVEPDAIASSLSRFTGVHRRDELTGIVDGVKIYQDYGHNPAEMRAALHVSKMKHPRRLWAVMQPHTYSRVITLFNDYLTCTEEADFTLVTDICAAREKDPGTVNSQMLVDGMRANGINAVLTPSFDDTEKYLREHWQPGDLVLTMGCGDINLLNDQITLHGDTKHE